MKVFDLLISRYRTNSHIVMYWQNGKFSFLTAQFTSGNPDQDAIREAVKNYGIRGNIQVIEVKEASIEISVNEPHFLPRREFKLLEVDKDYLGDLIASEYFPKSIHLEATLKYYNPYDPKDLIESLDRGEYFHCRDITRDTQYTIKKIFSLNQDCRQLMRSFSERIFHLLPEHFTLDISVTKGGEAHKWTINRMKA